MERAGSAARVDSRSLEEQGLDREATLHVGVAATGMERRGEATERGDLNREIAARNAERERAKEEYGRVEAQIINLDAERAKRADNHAIRSEAQTLDPERILASLTERRATFARADLNRHLTEFLPDAKQRSAYVDHVLARADVIPLREDEKAPISRYTTREVLSEENRLARHVERMAGHRSHGVTARALGDALDHHSHLDAEQRAAVRRATGGEGFSIIAGQAGTGKSDAACAIRDAYAADGYRVIGLAWTNAVAQDMKAKGFDEASTITSELMRQNAGRKPWNGRTVLMIDEAAMLSTRHMAQIAALADAAGAKLIPIGDAKQLAGIERGGMFPVFEDRHGAAQISTVRRVQDEEQKKAWGAMHRGDFRAALETFDKQGVLRWGATPEDAKAALVAKWTKDSADAPEKSRFAFAATNAEVHDLNAAIRAARKERGDLGADHLLQTREGEKAFATGDRVAFTASAANRQQRAAGLYTDAIGTIAAIDENRVTVALDAPKGAARREVSFTVGADIEAGEFDALRHAYAGTIYKGQGKTLDQSYLLHSPTWRSASAYVALSRHREDVALFASEKADAWVTAGGGLDGLTAKQRAGAERSFAAWGEAKPDLAAKYGLADYVGYVQGKWGEEKDLHRLDRMARQMGRIEENRAASQFVQAAREADATRKPPLSLVAGIVADYLKLCYEPAKDWLRWVAEDLKHRAAGRRGAAPEAGRDDAHTERPRAPVADADRICPDPLHGMQGGLDAQGRERRGADGVPSGSRAGSDRDDGLRPVRAEGRVERPAAKRADDDPAAASLRETLHGAKRETAERGSAEPEKISDFLKGRGRFRDKGRDR